MERHKMIALIAGHNKLRRGASNKDASVYEHDIMSDYVAFIAEKLNYFGVNTCIIDRPNWEYGSYRELINRINLISPQFFVSFHANSVDDTSISGCETLYYHTSSKSKALATGFQEAINSVLANKDRGIKPKRRKERGGVILADTKCPGIILEPFFISNNKDLDNFYSKCYPLATAIINKIKDFARFNYNLNQ